MDFTFNNAQIRNYFDGNASYTPSSELLYLHEHPLIKASFLQEIEVKINACCVVFEQHNLKGKVITDFIDLTKAMGSFLPDLNRETAPAFLEVLRKINTLCDKLLNQYRVK